MIIIYRKIIDKTTNVWYNIITENILTYQPICDNMSTNWKIQGGVIYDIKRNE